MTGAELDYTALRFWMDVFQLVATAAIGVYVWWDKHRTKVNERFAAIEEWQEQHEPKITALTDAEDDRDASCNRHKERTSKLEIDQREIQSDIRHLPGKRDIDNLTGQISALNAKLGQLDGRLTGINRAVDLMNQHLLKVD